MSEPSPERVKQVFGRAIELPAEERGAFVAQACGEDTALRDRVQRLLDALDDAEEFLASPTGPLPAAAAPRPGRMDSPTETSLDERAEPAHGTLAAGTMLGQRYRIVALAGRGGMGDVYQALDLKLHQKVALKLLPLEVSHDATRLSRLLEEARIARGVSHPNVCRVYDVAEAEGRHFLSMEWIEGQDLGTVLREKGRLVGDRAVLVARQICAGLAAAHDCGVLHRDLKPSNVMLDQRGVARITDFGIAEVSAVVRGERVREGTPNYMSPEQLAGDEVTFQSDIYALGLVLYEVFTGRRSHAGGTLEELARRRQDPPALPSALAPDIDPRVEKLILRCLERDPARRPASAAALVAALPAGASLGEALIAAQRRADRIAAFRMELAELRRAGLLQLSPEELRTVEDHHERLLRELVQQFDVDVGERGKQLSLGMRVVSFVGAFALAASVYYFFYRIWGTIGTALQVAILTLAPVVGLGLTAVVARRERARHFTLMCALVAFTGLVVDTTMLEGTFNLVPSPLSVLAWGLFALLLAYGFRLRLLLVAGVVLLTVFAAAAACHLGGGYWPLYMLRPETLFLGGLVWVALSFGPRDGAYPGFAPLYGVLGLVFLIGPTMFLGHLGVLSYLPLGRTPIETVYQLLGFGLSAAAIWIGIARRRRESVYSGSAFFVALLFLEFIDWWWNWMPKYLFFLIVAVTAAAVVLGLKRIRALLDAGSPEVEA